MGTSDEIGVLKSKFEAEVEKIRQLEKGGKFSIGLRTLINLIVQNGTIACRAEGNWRVSWLRTTWSRRWDGRIGDWLNDNKNIKNILRIIDRIAPLQELDRLEADAKVFKLIGPVLVKQDLAEARQNVEKRITYIRTEMWAKTKRA